MLSEQKLPYCLQCLHNWQYLLYEFNHILLSALFEDSLVMTDTDNIRTTDNEGKYDKPNPNKYVIIYYAFIYRILLLQNNIKSRIDQKLSSYIYNYYDYKVINKIKWISIEMIKRLLR